MYRGTTPTLTFTLPFSTRNIDNAYVSFAQRGAIVVDKPLSECTLNGNNLIVTLSQEETLSLKSGLSVEIQISVRIGDSVMRSSIMTTTVKRILKDEEIK